jgi:uncharacterized membrane protein
VAQRFGCAATHHTHTGGGYMRLQGGNNGRTITLIVIAVAAVVLAILVYFVFFAPR